MKKHKIIVADMMSCCGHWVKKQELNADDFVFVANYTDICKRIQIWKGSNKDVFILRDVKIKEY